MKTQLNDDKYLPIKFRDADELMIFFRDNTIPTQCNTNYY